MGKAARNRAKREKPEPSESIIFSGGVSMFDGKPFVELQIIRDGEHVFATRFRPSLCTALGLRAVQAAIEAERDAGLIAYFRGVGMDDQAISTILVGLRTHRDQFDAEEGTMRRLSPDDPSGLESPDEPT